MTNPLEYFWKDDPLKTADELIGDSHFGHGRAGKEIPISVSLLFISALFLAFSKSIYGEAGFSFTQHLITSLVLIFVGYIVVGVVLLTWKTYSVVNNILKCFFTCFIASLIVSLFCVYFSPQITDVSIDFVEVITTSNWLANRLPNLARAFLFSAVGCVSIYFVKRRENQLDKNWKEIAVFLVYWFATSIDFISERLIAEVFLIK